MKEPKEAKVEVRELEQEFLPRPPAAVTTTTDRARLSSRLSIRSRTRSFSISWAASPNPSSRRPNRHRRAMQSWRSGSA
jgi:hypothetical protein